MKGHHNLSALNSNIHSSLLIKLILFSILLSKQLLQMRLTNDARSHAQFMRCLTCLKSVNQLTKAPNVLFPYRGITFK